MHWRALVGTLIAGYPDRSRLNARTHVILCRTLNASKLKIVHSRIPILQIVLQFMHQVSSEAVSRAVYPSAPSCHAHGALLVRLSHELGAGLGCSRSCKELSARSSRCQKSWGCFPFDQKVLYVGWGTMANTVIFMSHGKSYPWSWPGAEGSIDQPHVWMGRTNLLSHTSPGARKGNHRS